MEGVFQKEEAGSCSWTERRGRGLEAGRPAGKMRCAPGVAGAWAELLRKEVVRRLLRSSSISSRSGHVHLGRRCALRKCLTV